MELQIFKRKGHELRGFMVDNEPYFVAKDAALALGYENPREAIREHVREKHRVNAGSMGGSDSLPLQKQTIIIKEAGLYSLIMRSKLKEAEEFQDWVIEDVLPSIRKTGSYSAKQNVPALPQTFAEALLLAGRLEEEKEKALALVGEKEKVIEKKDNFLKTIVHAKNTYTATEVAQTVGISAVEFNKTLVDAKILRKVGGVYVLYAKYNGYELIEIKETAPDDDGRTFKSLKWTAKGKGWIKSNWKSILDRAGKKAATSSADVALPTVPTKRKK
ncbi:phage antirepressor KilAC domain-containing protein [Sulfurimonas sp. SAG-AH-194-C20]|nr:phage antirepressor KilAC domain-containing protein [Sulfurimonas sp. SAG-AH-194-C20]MDF1879559.1 phage antirepressor KilAC domain-containing protein [Sulfurimonas sp. SAG-AH-194-C20]